MKIVIAPDAFKESLSAEHAAQAIARGFRRALPEADYVLCPVADGGEGTVAAIMAATQGRLISLTAQDPLGRPRYVQYGITGDGTLAVIEMAAASGLMCLSPDERNPMLTSSYGTGELILDALDRGVQRILLGIGGTATVDGGLGMLQALGVSFTNNQGVALGRGGGQLAKLQHIDLNTLDPRLKECQFAVACDVSNPLLGPQGAAAVFAPQKGATPEQSIQLEQALTHLAAQLQKFTSTEIAVLPGGGAAGGVGATLHALLGVSLRPGVEQVIEAVGLEQHLVHADLVVTGEGKLDSQTQFGKAPLGVAHLAKQHHIPVIALAGAVTEGSNLLYQHGIHAMFSILPYLSSLDTALEQAEHNLETCAHNVARVLRLGMPR